MTKNLEKRKIALSINRKKGVATRSINGPVEATVGKTREREREKGEGEVGEEEERQRRGKEVTLHNDRGMIIPPPLPEIIQGPKGIPPPSSHRCQPPSLLLPPPPPRNANERWLNTLID